MSYILCDMDCDKEINKSDIEEHCPDCLCWTCPRRRHGVLPTQWKRGVAPRLFQCHVMSWRHGISYHISWHVNMTSNKLNCKGEGLRGLRLQHQEPVYHMLGRMSWHVVMSRTRNVSVKRQHWYHSEWDWLGMGIQEPDPAPACAYDNTRWNLKPMWEKAVNKSGAYTW